MAYQLTIAIIRDAVMTLKYIGLTLLGLFIIYPFFSVRNRCNYGVGKMVIDSIQCGNFIEYIPQTGNVVLDSTGRFKEVKVNIDELYAERICIGLKAVTTVQNHDLYLQITDLYPEIIDGRFSVRMKFVEQALPSIEMNKQVRMRIELGEESDAIRLPVGGFNIDTGGKWIFVIGRHNRAKRRDIQLRRKMGSEYFEVLDGLKPGERAIISAYDLFNGEGFDGKDSVDLSRFDPEYHHPYGLKQFRQDVLSYYNRF